MYDTRSYMSLKRFHLKIFQIFTLCFSEPFIIFYVVTVEGVHPLPIHTPYPFNTLAYAGIYKSFSKVTEKNFMYFKILLSTHQPLLPHFIMQRSIRWWHPNPNHLRSKLNTDYQIGQSSRWQSMMKKQGQKDRIFVLLQIGHVHILSLRVQKPLIKFCVHCVFF